LKELAIDIREHSILDNVLSKHEDEYAAVVVVVLHKWLKKSLMVTLAQNNAKLCGHDASKLVSLDTVGVEVVDHFVISVNADCCPMLDLSKVDRQEDPSPARVRVNPHAQFINLVQRVSFGQTTVPLSRGHLRVKQLSVNLQSN
jgi:hypothetical protein